MLFLKFGTMFDLSFELPEVRKPAIIAVIESIYWHDHNNSVSLNLGNLSF
jgi:hypothetical protein